MTVVLVLSTFLIFVFLDYLLNRQPVPLAEAEAEPAKLPELEPDFVGGFLVPETVRFHPGHSWLARERRNLARVGVDELAAALAGRIDRVELPRPGQWIRQGQKTWAFHRNGDKAEMVSPAEGEVVEVNREVLADPSLVRKDPYGRGWMILIGPRDPGERANLMTAAQYGAFVAESGH